MHLAKRGHYKSGHVIANMPNFIKKIGLLLVAISCQLDYLGRIARVGKYWLVASTMYAEGTEGLSWLKGPNLCYAIRLVLVGPAKFQGMGFLNSRRTSLQLTADILHRIKVDKMFGLTLAEEFNARTSSDDNCSDPSALHPHFALKILFLSTCQWVRADEDISSDHSSLHRHFALRILLLSTCQ